MTRCALAVLLAAASLSFGAAAEALPSIWDRARDPSSSRAERVSRRIQRVMDGEGTADVADLEALRDFRLGALAIAEMSGARAFDDPRLSLLLAQAMIEADLGGEGEAESLLLHVIEQLESGATWLEAEARVLLAAAARGMPELALERVSRALPLVWDPATRSALLRERAEARMALGDVRGSAADQRAALSTAQSPVQRALARFGLGLALERGGDLPGALGELRLAHASAPPIAGTDLGILELPGAFVFRPFDAHYTAALSAMGRARLAADPERALLDYERAVVGWEHFVAAAPSDDRWVPAARLYQSGCERELDALRQKLEARPPAPE